MIKSNCESGNRTIAFKKTDRCIIVPKEDRISEEYTWVSVPPLNETDAAMLLISDLQRYETCVVSQDLFLHPVIKGFLIAVAILWCLIVLTLVCLFSKYRNLKYRYSQLGEEPAGGASNPNNMSQGGEIEM